MGGGISLGRIFGIPLRLHYTWFLIFTLITAALVAYFPQAYPLWQRVSLGLASSVLFLISIIAHEIAHSIVAKTNGIPVRSITLFMFGGVAHITKEVTTPVLELLMALVGPLASLLIAGIFSTLGSILVSMLEMKPEGILVTGLDWLTYMNVMLALLNLVPGFPLDGGRVLRAILWIRTHNYNRATRIATFVGRGVGFLSILGGILIMVLAGQWFAGLWLAFIGWFLENAATTSYRHALLREALHGFTAKDVMTAECPLVSGELSLGELVRDFILPTGRRCFLVSDSGAIKGIVTLHNIKLVPQNRWDGTRINEIMTPADRLKTADPSEPALNLLEDMDEWNINQLPVMEGGKVIGMVARDGLIHFLRTRTELGI